MSSKGHNKRRNAALLYEWLVRSISVALVEGDNKKSSVALKLLKKHFKPGTELHREFRLVNSLAKTTVNSEAVAASIMQEAKVSARSHDVVQLDKEKSLLIHAINKSMNDPDFYDQQVNEYRTLATIQMLINDWRSPDRDLGRMAQYEDQVIKHLLSERVAAPDITLSDESPGTSRLLMKVLAKKLNEKYGQSLNESQKGLVRAYAFATANDDPTAMSKKLNEVKQQLLESIASFEKDADNVLVNKKLAETRVKVLAEDTNGAVDDAMVARFMLYTKLADELTQEDSGEDDA